VVTTPRLMRTVDAPRLHFAQATSLTEDGQKLIQGFDADREAIQKEVDQKIQARREAVIKELEKLQDQYAKAGKLDEAVAIRDYLRAGGPSATSNIAFRRIAR
jgi:excinuclease UvrABC helicase subunit UvrB